MTSGLDVALISQRLSLSLVYHHFEFTFGKGAAFFFRFENTVVLLLKYKISNTRKYLTGNGLDLDCHLGRILCVTTHFKIVLIV